MISTKIIDLTSFKIDKNGIYRSNNTGKQKTNTSEVWNKIYNFNVNELIKMHSAFNRDKLGDLLKYFDLDLLKNKPFVYLEIGCGPAFLGKHLLDKYKCIFVGVDLNYNALLQLKRFFEHYKIEQEKYVLIESDIRSMPLKDDSIDLVYGGGVIEHIPNTEVVLNELHRILKRDGTSVNSVPALNLFWLTRFFMSIPNLPLIKKLFETIHINILKEKILSKFYGYELSFTQNKLKELHKKAGFKNIKTGCFSFHPNIQKIKSKQLYDLYYNMTRNKITTPFYFVTGNK